jgi:hypothetical protein
VSSAAREAALEALAAGDYRLVEEILLGAGEDEWSPAPSLTSTNTTQGGLTCACGLSFAWPGLLDHHRRFAHGLEDAA